MDTDNITHLYNNNNNNNVQILIYPSVLLSAHITGLSKFLPILTKLLPYITSRATVTKCAQHTGITSRAAVTRVVAVHCLCLKAPNS